MDNAQENEKQTEETQTAEAQQTEAAQKEQEQPEEQKPTELETLQKKYDELNDRYLRTCAEYDNYRKRTIRERADLLKSAGSYMIEGLLPVIDNFERAISHMGEATDVAALKEGVDLIYKQFNDFLTKKGVSVIETTGLELDTNVHEAITMMPAPTPDMKGKIFDCVEKGYKMGDKVLRFAKVVVCQ